MKRFRLRFAVGLLLFFAFTFVSPTAASATGGSLPLDSASSFRSIPSEPPGNCEPGWVHLYAVSGQNINDWTIRVTGTDLPKLVNDNAGSAYIHINDNNGGHDLQVRWDLDHSLNTTIDVSGPSPQILISITNSNDSYTGCSMSTVFNYQR